MAVYHPTKITCSCGRRFEADLAESINAERTPSVREKILAGEFHKIRCPACGSVFAVEKPFYYVDLLRNSIFQVRARSQRYRYKSDSKQLAAAVQSIPETLSTTGSRKLRVVYGLDELREKIAAQDAGLDDRMVELLKVLALHEHPFLMQKPRLQLFLGAARSHELTFIAYHHNHPGGFEISMPRPAAEDFLAKETEIRQWADSALRKSSLFHPKDFWVNFRRWTTRYSALEMLHLYAVAIEKGKEVSLTSDEAKLMFERLPRASQLPSRAKQELRTLFLYAKANHLDAVEDTLFEIRFGIELEDEWAKNADPDDIDTIWTLLREVPVTNVEGNTKLKAIDLFKGGGGFYQWNGVIEVGDAELRDKERFEDVLRHEVGHAVHANLDAIITPWLEKQFGWRFLNPSPEGVDTWVMMMGGWGDLNPPQREQVTQFLLSALGPGGSWQPGPTPNPPANNPWWSPNFGPRLAFEQTGASWYGNFPLWHRANGRAFFMNYWYRSFMVVNINTLDNFVARMPSNYAAMSHFEFFAELYSLYYDKDDPMRQIITDQVALWLDENVGTYNPENPRRPSAPRQRMQSQSTISAIS